MKRDMDLIRNLLIFYERDGVAPYPAADAAVVNEHIVLLIEAGLVSGNIDASGIDDALRPVAIPGHLADVDGYRRWVYRLTWSGHEFMAAARDDTIWQKATGTLGSALGGVGMEVLKEYLKDCALRAVGLVP